MSIVSATWSSMEKVEAGHTLANSRNPQLPWQSRCVFHTPGEVRRCRRRCRTFLGRIGEVAAALFGKKTKRMSCSRCRLGRWSRGSRLPLQVRLRVCSRHTSGEGACGMTISTRGIWPCAATDACSCSVFDSFSWPKRSVRGPLRWAQSPSSFLPR